MQFYLNASNSTESTNAINCNVLIAQRRLSGTSSSNSPNFHNHPPSERCECSRSGTRERTGGGVAVGVERTQREHGSVSLECGVCDTLHDLSTRQNTGVRF